MSLILLVGFHIYSWVVSKLFWPLRIMGSSLGRQVDCVEKHIPCNSGYYNLKGPTMASGSAKVSIGVRQCLAVGFTHFSSLLSHISMCLEPCWIPTESHLRRESYSWKLLCLRTFSWIDWVSKHSINVSTSSLCFDRVINALMHNTCRPHVTLEPNEEE